MFRTDISEKKTPWPLRALSSRCRNCHNGLHLIFCRPKSAICFLLKFCVVIVVCLLVFLTFLFILIFRIVSIFCVFSVNRFVPASLKLMFYLFLISYAAKSSFFISLDKRGKSLKLILYPNVWQVAVLKNGTEYFWAKKEGAVPTGKVHQTDLHWRFPILSRAFSNTLLSKRNIYSPWTFNTPYTRNQNTLWMGSIFLQHSALASMRLDSDTLCHRLLELKKSRTTCTLTTSWTFCFNSLLFTYFFVCLSLFVFLLN